MDELHNKVRKLQSTVNTLKNKKIQLWMKVKVNLTVTEQVCIMKEVQCNINFSNKYKLQ